MQITEQDLDRRDHRIDKIILATEDRLIGKIAESEVRMSKRIEESFGEMSVLLMQEMDIRFERFEKKLDDKFNAKFSAFSTRFLAIENRLDSLEVRFGQLEARFDRLEIRFDQLESRFDKLEAHFDQLEARFDQLEVRFDKLEARFDKIEDLLLKVLGGQGPIKA